MRPSDRLSRAWRFIRMGDGDWQIRAGRLMLARMGGKWMLRRV